MSIFELFWKLGEGGYAKIPKCQFTSPLTAVKGRVTLPKRMIFWKSSKWLVWGGVIFNPKIHVPDFRPLNMAFFGCVPKKLQHQHRLSGLRPCWFNFKVIGLLVSRVNFVGNRLSELKVLLEDHRPMITIDPNPIHFCSQSPRKAQHDSRRTRTTSNGLKWTDMN